MTADRPPAHPHVSQNKTQSLCHMLGSADLSGSMLFSTEIPYFGKHLLCTNYKSYGGGIRPGHRKERVREKQGEELKEGLKEERKEKQDC